MNRTHSGAYTFYAERSSNQDNFFPLAKLILKTNFDGSTNISDGCTSYFVLSHFDEIFLTERSAYPSE